MDFRGELANIVERYSKEITDLIKRFYPEDDDEEKEIENLALKYSYKMYNSSIIRKFRPYQNEIYYKLLNLLEKIYDNNDNLQIVNDSLFGIYTTITGDNKISVQEFIDKYSTLEKYYYILKENGIYYEINVLINKMIIESEKVKLK